MGFSSSLGENNKTGISLDISLRDIGMEGTVFKELEGSFIHFTNVRSLFSILNEGFVRMYDLNNANDKRELYYASKFGKVDIERFKSHYYTLSMCDKNIHNSDNCLDIWRFYGDNGAGVGIELEIKNLNKNLNSGFHLSRVLYDINIETAEKFKEAHSDFNSNNNCEIDVSAILTHISNYYKSLLFKTENEVRLVHYNSNYEACSEKIGFDFHKSNYVKYYKLPVITYATPESNYTEPCVLIKDIMFGFKYTESKVREFRELIYKELSRYISPGLRVSKCNIDYNIFI